jgi:glutathione S-transferase
LSRTDFERFGGGAHATQVLQLAGPMMITLYYSPGACSLAAHVALEEAQADFEAKRIAIADGDNIKPEFLAINPRGFVPALDVDGQVITENVAVLIYVASRFPEAQLLPFDHAFALARAIQQMVFLSGSLHIAYAQLWRPHRFTADENVHEQISEGGRERILNYHAEIERQLAETAYFAGDEYSLVDPYLLVFYRWGKRIGIEMSYPHWAEHSRIVLQRPAVRRAIEREGLAFPDFLP